MRGIVLLVLLPWVALAQLALPRNFAPHASVGPTPLPNSIGCYGDSIMAGACQNINICVRVSDGIAGSTSSNDGISGYTAAQISCSDGIHLQDTGGKTGPQTLACDVLTALGYACP